MRRIALAIAILPLASLIMAFFKPTTTIVKFSGDDWEQAQSRAKSERKLYFVDFDASYCASCRNMDQTTYQDAALASFMSNNVVALRLDVQDFDGVMWSQKYEVEALPTMLIFDENGKFVKRLVGYQSANDLLSEFQTAQGGTSSTSKGPTIQPVTEDKPMLKPVTSRNADDNKPTSRASSNTVNLKPVTRNRPASMYDRPTGGPSGLGLYEIQVQKTEIEGYTVQVGVYSSNKITLEQANKVRQKFKDQRMFIHLDEMNGQEVQKLLVGTFESKRSATAFRQQLQRMGMDGLVKDLATMK